MWGLLQQPWILSSVKRGLSRLLWLQLHGKPELSIMSLQNVSEAESCLGLDKCLGVNEFFLQPVPPLSLLDLPLRNGMYEETKHNLCTFAFCAHANSGVQTVLPIPITTGLLQMQNLHIQKGRRPLSFRESLKQENIFTDVWSFARMALAVDLSTSWVADSEPPRFPQDFKRSCEALLKIYHLSILFIGSLVETSAACQDYLLFRLFGRLSW